MRRRAVLALALCPGLSACSGPPAETETEPVPFTVGELTGPAVVHLGEEGCFDVEHTGGDAALVAWSFGDGTSLEAAAGASHACHTWEKPGHLLVAATVERGGQKGTASVAIASVPKPMAQPPSASSTIVYDAERAELWVVNPDAGTVARLAADPPSLVEEIPVCDGPRTLALHGGVLAVACQGDGTVRLLDAATGGVESTVDLGAGSRPFGIAADPRGGHFYVTLQASGELAVLDAGSGQAVGRIPVGPDVRGVAALADGTALVTRWRAVAEGAEIHVVDVTDPKGAALTGTLVLPPDTGVNSDTDNDGVPGFLNQVVPSPDGGRAVLPSLKANTVSGSYLTGEPLLFDTTARALLTEVKLAGPFVLPVEPAGGRHPFDDLDYASALVFSPEGSIVYAAIQGAERVEVRDAFTYDVAGSIDSVGHAPQGLALSPDGARLFVQALLSRSVLVYDVTDLSQPPSPLAEIATVNAEPLAAAVLEGKRIFYRSRDPRMSGTSYLSCASCHLDGESDGLVWDFTQRGEGLRNTISLLGRAGLAHGPLHWSANFDEVQDFEHDIRGPMGGAGFLPDDLFHMGTTDTTLGDPKAGLSAELDALAAYVTSLNTFGISPHRRDGDAAWTAKRESGKALFFSAEAACSSCHAPPRFTDSVFLAENMPVLHDVGTLGPGSGQRLGGPLEGIDTPTLRGLWDGAPYLHDGSARTLREVLVDHNPMDQHGKTSQLSDADLDALETFLLTIDDAER
jgi:DNA-binding beta-propeller fold protein YncE